MKFIECVKEALKVAKKSGRAGELGLTRIIRQDAVSLGEVHVWSDGYVAFPSSEIMIEDLKESLEASDWEML